ncbi:MAG: MarR family winged helix-turn-helix transcriptional regulator [Candidatus Limnocylindria bacterium]
MKSIHHASPSARASGPDKAVERLFELAVLLADGMERGLAERGLSRARAELLWRLGQQGPMTQRDLSRALACTPRNVTGLVDALEAGGLVARHSHPSDRRATLVTLTERGAAATAQMQADYGDLAMALFGDLDPTDVARFIGDVDRIVKRLRGEVVPTAEPG